MASSTDISKLYCKHSAWLCAESDQQ